MVTENTWSLKVGSHTRPPLSLNVDLNRYAAARIKKDLRELSGWLARGARIPKLECGTVALVWYVTDARRRDPHNFTLTLKPLVDGLVDAGVFPDDDYLHVKTDVRIERVASGPASLVLEVSDIF